METVTHKTRRIFIWIIAGLSALLVLASVSLSQIDFSSKIKGFEEAANNFIVQTLHSDTLLPPPLRGVFGEPKEPLTGAGVLMWTNKNREDAGVKDLIENATLSEMAKEKLNDLFVGQYFEHESPSGVGPGDLAKQVGYDYIVIGENLALGNFDGDKALVDAWMASPGHRANILNTRYQEIGVAVGQGVFEGKKTWIAVQEFGLPVTACPQPSRANKAAIDQGKKTVDALEASLGAQKIIIDGITLKYGDDYNAKVEKYNTTVHQFNAAVIALKAKISAYNKEVATFNNCAEVASTTPEII
jgi:outer membrane murein-binding lipoprotein Lpp